MHQVSKLLSNNNIKHWLDYGTLLHGYRDKAINSSDVTPKGICSSDNKLNDVDFDVSFLFKDYDKIREVFKNANISYVVEIENSILRLTDTMRMTDIPQRQKYSMWVDLVCWHEMSDSKKLINEYEFDIQKTRLSKYFIKELDEIELYGYKFPVPRYTEKFLQLRYGNSWLTPMTKEYYEEHAIDINKTLFQENNITVLVDGVWDLFHQGHVELLKRAHDIYDKVIVGIASDDLVRSYKRDPIIQYEDRVKMLEACKYVDEIYHNAPVVNITEKVLDSCGADYALHSVADSNNWKTELRELAKYDQSLIDSGRAHFLSYTNYHTTDIINMVLKKYT